MCFTMIAVGWLFTIQVAATAQGTERLIARVPERFSIAPRQVTAPDGTKRASDEFSVTWSPNGARIGYIGHVGDVPYPVIDETVGDPYHYASSPSFSADGLHSAFRVGKRLADRKERWWVLLDGKAVDPQDWLGGVTISPDGKSYAAWRQPGARIAADGSYTRGAQELLTPWKSGEKWEDADSLMPPRFARDGSFVCALGSKSGQWRLLLADKKGERVLGTPQPWITGYDVAPDGKSFALEVYDPSRADSAAPPPMPGDARAKSTVLFGKSTYGREFDSAFAPRVSPDGKHAAWIFRKGGREGVAIDDGKQARVSADVVRELTFSPDGRALAYLAGTGGARDTLELDDRGQPVVRGASWQVARAPAGGGPAALDTESYLDARDLTWSLDGKRIALCARTAEGWRVVCGAVQSAAFDAVGPPHFSPDATHVAFGARHDRELWWKVLALDR